MEICRALTGQPKSVLPDRRNDLQPAATEVVFDSTIGIQATVGKEVATMRESVKAGAGLPRRRCRLDVAMARACAALA